MKIFKILNGEQLTKKRIGVIGLGMTCKAILNYLLDKVDFIWGYDDDSSKIRIAQQAVHKGNIHFSSSIDIDIIKTLDFVIISPGISTFYKNPHPVIKACQKFAIPALGELDLFYHFYQKYLDAIAVTGTNGKSTTVSLIHHMLKRVSVESILAGNIGAPLFDCLIKTPKPLPYVIELSSFQLESVRCAKFNVAVLLTITPDHLDRYQDITEYVEAKMNIFNNQVENNYAIISVNTKRNLLLYQSLLEKHKQNVIPISSNAILKNGISVLDGMVHDNYFHKSSFSICIPPALKGEHNAENIAATYAVLKIKGITREIFTSSLTSFEGLEHRMEEFHKHENLVFVNDSKATNIASAKFALNAYKDIYWIAGGIFKEEGLDELIGSLTDVRRCYLIGRDAQIFAKMLKKQGVPFEISNTLDKAVQTIKKQAKKGVVLLSPACSSLDQWENFIQRGKIFKELVKILF